MRRRWAIIVTAAAALAAAIFAVLSLTDGEGSPLAQAGERIEGQSMRMALDLSMEMKEGRMHADGTGVVSADGTKGVLEVRYTLKGLMRNLPMEIRVVGDDIWMHADRFGSFMPPGKRWVHSRDTETPSESLTPAEYSRFLAGADDVRVVDDDASVRGKPTTYYKGVVNVREIAEKIGGDTQERYERLFGDRSAGVPIEAWIGRDGLPVRIGVECPTFAMTADILDYGVPVNVEPPPAGATIEEDEFDRLTA
jgi:hypothetical protein